jgi:hypothetical protein
MRLAVVDTGPLYAAADADDDDHAACARALRDRGYRLVIPALVIAEATYLVGTRLGARAEVRFLASLAALDVEAPAASDWSRIAELAERYRDFPLVGVDASVVALAERLGCETILTLDHRHFSAVRPKHCAAFTLLPE